MTEVSKEDERSKRAGMDAPEVTLLQLSLYKAAEEGVFTDQKIF